ncbi:hypothetical protein SNE40_015184 [Patella caerulea]|uniref:Uncharacterized protein n=1 Tax=Patella caerulea TaxID=87958 RepID=A0AAN8JJE1_PATCE
MDHNEHTSRQTRTKRHGKPIVGGQFSRKTKQWVAYEKLEQKEYPYTCITNIPWVDYHSNNSFIENINVFCECMHELYVAVESSYCRGERSLELDEVAPNLPGEKPTNTSELFAQMKKKKTLR